MQGKTLLYIIDIMQIAFTVAILITDEYGLGIAAGITLISIVAAYMA